MRANFHCLDRDHAWLRRYQVAWIALALFGLAAFALGDRGVLALGTQGLFFIAVFSVILWPVRAAMRADCDLPAAPGREARP